MPYFLQTRATVGDRWQPCTYTDAPTVKKINGTHRIQTAHGTGPQVRLINGEPMIKITAAEAATSLDTLTRKYATDTTLAKVAGRT